MDTTVWQDSAGTHIDWALDGVTARMIDWFVRADLVLAHWDKR